MLYTSLTKKKKKVYYRPTYLKELFPLNSGGRNLIFLIGLFLILQKGKKGQCDIKISVIPTSKQIPLDKLVLDKPSLVETLHIHNDRYNRGNMQLVCIEDQ